MQIHNSKPKFYGAFNQSGKRFLIHCFKINLELEKDVDLLNEINECANRKEEMLKKMGRNSRYNILFIYFNRYKLQKSVIFSRRICSEMRLFHGPTRHCYGPQIVMFCLWTQENFMGTLGPCGHCLRAAGLDRINHQSATNVWIKVILTERKFSSFFDFKLPTCIRDSIE